MSAGREENWITADTEVGQHLQHLCLRLAAERALPRGVTLGYTPNLERVQEVTLNRLSLIAEEFLNASIRHGFASGGGGRIGVTLDVCPWGLELTVEDSDTSVGRRGAGMGKVRHLVVGMGGALDLPQVIGGHRWVVTVPSEHYPATALVGQVA